MGALEGSFSCKLAPLAPKPGNKALASSAYSNHSCWHVLAVLHDHNDDDDDDDDNGEQVSWQYVGRLYDGVLPTGSRPPASYNVERAGDGQRRLQSNQSAENMRPDTAPSGCLVMR